MAAPRRVIDLKVAWKELVQLQSIARSRTESSARVERARVLVAYRDDPSCFAVGRSLGPHHRTVQRCVERAAVQGALAALDETPRPGRELVITVERRACLVALACRSAKNLGYPHEVLTPRLLVQHAREYGPAAGHALLRDLAQGAVCEILDAEEVKPHKVRYYLRRRDPEFQAKMAEVMCICRQVKLRKRGRPGDAVAIITYDEKPGVRAVDRTAPDLPPEPGVYTSFARVHEYQRHGTVSLLAGIDLISGKIHSSVTDCHCSREFIQFLALLDTTYPAHTAIKLLLDNHSAHISQETCDWHAEQHPTRFELVFTPKHGSWLNLIEGFFSKLAHSVRRPIRVASVQELKDRLSAAIDRFNRNPVIHTWTDMLDRAA